MTRVRERCRVGTTLPSRDPVSTGRTRFGRGVSGVPKGEGDEGRPRKGQRGQGGPPSALGQGRRSTHTPPLSVRPHTTLVLPGPPEYSPVLVTPLSGGPDGEDRRTGRCSGGLVGVQGVDMLPSTPRTEDIRFPSRKLLGFSGPHPSTEVPVCVTLKH